MKKLILLLALSLTFTTTAFATEHTSKEEVAQIIKNQSAPAKSTVKEVYNDSKSAISTIHEDLTKIAPKLESAVTSIASGLKVGANNVWAILVKQQQVWSWCFLILTISSILNWIFFYKRNFPTLKESESEILERDIIGDILNPRYEAYYKDRNDDPRGKQYIKGPIGKEQYRAYHHNKQPKSDWHTFINVIHLIICITISIFSFLHFSDMLTGFINPEFGAMRNIVEFAQSIK